MRLRRAVRSIAVLAAAAGLGAAAGGAERAADPNAAVHSMVQRVVGAPEATAGVVIERSDPFGGPPDRERGRVWYLPGRGLRYRSAGSKGQDVLIDRARDAFLVYNPSERVVYRAPFTRAPSRLRRLIAEPGRVLSANFHAVPERRSIQGVSRAGYRLRSASLGDSLPEVTIWVAPDPSSGLPRWIAFAAEGDSLLITLERLEVRKRANPGDLALSAPAGTPEEPLDPRELLGGGRGESR